VTVDAYPVLFNSKPRQIVITLCRMGADDMLEFREKGTRSRWLLAYRRSVQIRSAADSYRQTAW
jgi:hypothetical protein